MPKSLQASLLIEVLDLGIKVNQFDEKLFREYLEMPLAQQYNVLKEKKMIAASRVAAPVKAAVVADPGHWNRYIANVQ